MGETIEDMNIEFKDNTISFLSDKIRILHKKL